MAWLGEAALDATHAATAAESLPPGPHAPRFRAHAAPHPGCDGQQPPLPVLLAAPGGPGDGPDCSRPDPLVLRARSSMGYGCDLRPAVTLKAMEESRAFPGGIALARADAACAAAARRDIAAVSTRALQAGR